MTREGYSKITQVKVRLRGQFPFPIVLGNSADPAYVEREIATLAGAVLEPGYDTKPNPHTRLPYVIIHSIPDRYLQNDGSYDIPPGAEDVRAPLANLPEQCSVIVESLPDKIKLDFKDAALGTNIRSISFRHDFLKDAIRAYLAEQNQAEEGIKKLQQEYAELCETEIEKREYIRLRIQSIDGYRKDTHNMGSTLIGSESRRQGVVLWNRTLTQDLEARVFELVSFLMRDGWTYTAPQFDATSRRETGKFRDVQVGLDRNFS